MLSFPLRTETTFPGPARTSLKLNETWYTRADSFHLLLKRFQWINWSITDRKRERAEFQKRHFFFLNAGTQSVVAHWLSSLFVLCSSLPGTDCRAAGRARTTVSVRAFFLDDGVYVRTGSSCRRSVSSLLPWLLLVHVPSLWCNLPFFVECNPQWSRQWHSTRTLVHRACRWTHRPDGEVAIRIHAACLLVSYEFSPQPVHCNHDDGIVEGHLHFSETERCDEIRVCELLTSNSWNSRKTSFHISICSYIDLFTSYWVSSSCRSSSCMK